jgi:hypothetical protein
VSNDRPFQSTERWGMLEYWIAFWLLWGAIVGWTGAVAGIGRSQQIPTWSSDSAVTEIVLGTFFGFVGTAFAALLVMHIRGVKA